MATSLRRIDLRPRDAQLGPEEAATLLGLTRAQVYRQLAEGIIPSRKVGKRYVIFRNDVERLSATTSADEPRGIDLAGLIQLLATGEIEADITIRLRRVER